MSLFSKIKNVIQKEQHKYTAPSLSSSLTPDSFDLTELALYGLPSTVSTLAYDPVQSLLAVGTFQGTILLFGKPGITAHLALPESAAILFLSFQVGEARLVSVDSHQNLVVFNLESFEASFVHKVASPVSCMDLLLGTEYMLLGLRNGYIEMYNISRGFKSGYVIEPISIESENNNSPSLCVVAVQVHPIDTNQLLIGYSSGLIALWDLRSRRVVKYYQYGGPSTVVAPKFWNFKEDDISANYGGHLTVIAWRPDGSHFISGYDDGTIVFWDIKNDKKPLLARTISEPDLSANYDGSAKAPVPAGSVKREPIFKILWCSVSDSEDTHVAIAGGSLNQDLRGIRVFDYQGKDYRAPRRLRMLAVSEDLADMFVFPKESPWYNGTRDPAAIAIIIPSGAVKLHEFNAGFSPCSIPSELQWLDPRISSAKLVVNCPDYLYKNLVFGYEHPTSYGGIVKGGIQASVDSENLKKLMLTIHQDGSLRIWKCSHSNLILLKHITFVPGSIHPTISKSQISFVDPCFENGQLVIGFNSGHVLQYWFKMSEDETSNFNYIVESVENLAPTRENMNFTEANGHGLEQASLPLKKATTIATRTYMPEPASSANKSIANASSQNRLRSSSQPAPDTSKEIPAMVQATNAPPRTTSLSLESPSEIVVTETSKENMSPREPTKLNIMQGPLHSEPQTKDTVVMSHQDSVDVSAGSLADDIRDFDSTKSIQNNISNTTPHSSPKSNSESLKSEASNSTLEVKLVDDTSLQSSRKNSEIRQGDIPTNGQDSISSQDENYPNNSPLSHPSRDIDNSGVKSKSTDEHRSHEGLADLNGETNTNNGNSSPTQPYSASENSVNENTDDRGFANLLRLSPNYLNMGSYPLVPSLLIRCHQGTVNNIVSTEIGLLALSDEEGTLSIVDTIGQKLIFYQDYSDQSHPSEAEVGAEAYSVNSVTVDRITAMMFVESYTKETDHLSIKLVTGSFRGVFRVFNVHLNGGIYAVSEDAVFRTKDKSPAIYVNVVNMKGLPQRPCKYKSGEASIADSEIDHVDSPKLKPKTESHYFICCSEESIRIHFNCSATKLHKCMIRKEDGKIVKASISRYQDQSCFVALTNVGLIKIFSLPKLAHIIDIPITHYIPERLKDSIITDDGRVLVSTAQYQYREYTFFKENSFVSLIPKVYRMYNKAKRVPEKPMLNSTWWFGGSEAASSHDINELLGKGFTDRKAKQREQPESSRAQDEAQSTASVLADAGRMLNERGEKLNRLQDTVANMEASSAGFLDDIREYNKRMAAKKWYQL